MGSPSTKPGARVGKTGKGWINGFQQGREASRQGTTGKDTTKTLRVNMQILAGRIPSMPHILIHSRMTLQQLIVRSHFLLEELQVF